MPKGGLLHVHLDATVNIQVLLQIAVQHPSMHVRLNENPPLPEFRPLPPGQSSTFSSLTDSSYVTGSWIPLKKARDNHHGGPAAFDSWIVKLMTIDPGEAYGTHNTTSKVSNSLRVRITSELKVVTPDLGEICKHIRCGKGRFLFVVARKFGLTTMI